MRRKVFSKMKTQRTAYGLKALPRLASFAAVAAIAILMAANGAAASAQAAAAPAATANLQAVAQDVVGIWQGTLHAGKDLRCVVKISKSSTGYTAQFYSIDQTPQPIPVTKATFADGTLQLSIDAIGGKYEGKMSADGKTIAGNWTQGPNPLVLNLERATPDTAWPIPEPLHKMAADANPGFDVVTIKPSEPGSPGKGFGFQGTHLKTLHTNMNDLVAFAYGMHAKQIVGAPDWFGTDLFDIDGVPDVPGVPTLHQQELMMQKLLPDRFQLKFHHEQRELAVYIITLGSGGSKMTKTSFGPSDPQGFGLRGLGDLVVTNMSMAEFATWMQTGVMDKPVVDHTGLTDKYDFNLKWTPDESQFAQFRGTNGPTPPPAGDNPNAPPALYTATQEQLGIKFEAGKAMDDVIVIDHVEKPSPN